ncbi:hypothetical protein [Snodgrassella alvi]|uniref:hypothetical protein n=1 Tax=Snodgrassella alvi TaxID=1196083 RepID=UPI003460230E
MKKKEIKLTRGRLAQKGASKELLEFFKERYPNDSAPISEVLRELQELSNTDIDYGEYVEYAIWLVDNFPPTQEPLVLNELTEKVIIHNGNLTINCDIDGDRIIIGNGDLNIEGGANLTGRAVIWAKNVKGQNITLYDCATIWAGAIDTINIAAYDDADIFVEETIDTINIAAYDQSEIWAYEINAQNIMDDSRWGIRGDINLIQPSSNPQNVTQPAN